MKCIAFLGQSPAVEMFREVDSLEADTPRACTKMWDAVEECWVPPVGVGAIAFANYVSEALEAAGLDDEVRLYDAASGGAALLAAHAQPSGNHWSAGGDCLPALYAQVDAGCTKPDVVIWWQGWQDYLFANSNMRGDYQTALGTLFSALKTEWSKPGLLMNVWPSGVCNYGGYAPGYSPYVQAAQISFATSVAGAALGPSNYDLPLRDGVHYTGESYRRAGVRGAIAVLAQLGVRGFKGLTMPQVTSVSRSGASFVLNANMALYPWSASPNGTACTGVKAWDMNWSWVPITSVWLLGNQVRIEFQYVTGAHIAYARGSDSDVTRVPCTDIKGERFALTPIADESVFSS